ncbi:MAG: molybdopterin dinucleotide binding domain-containing protein [Armatimonadota bacterium]
MYRRDFLKLVIGGAAISFGAEALRYDRLIPFLDPPAEIVPGVATWFATSCPECPAGCGMLVANREARAIKAEGNPLHPINRGKLCARGQAALQGLYDPDRLRQPLRREGRRERSLDWDHALDAIGRELAVLRGSGRVAVVSDLQSGSLASLIGEWVAAFGSDRYLVYEPFSYQALREANRLVFGREVIPDYHLDKCDFVLSLGADFVETWISPVKWIRRFAETREPSNGAMSKLVYVGPRLSLTGMNADEYLLLPPGGERWLGLALLHALAEEGLARRDAEAMRRIAAGFSPEQVGPWLGIEPARVRRLARLLGRAKRPVVLAGSPVPAGRAATEAAAVAGLLNRALGSTAVDFSRAHALGETASLSELRALTDDIGQGRIRALVIVGANPAYSLPPDLRFPEAVAKADLVLSLSPVADETARLATWALPTSTSLESWGDYRPETGVVNLMQPVMGERLSTRSPGDILLSLARTAGVDPAASFGAASYYDYLRRRWRELASAAAPGADPETFWRDALRRGGHWAGTPAPSPNPLPPLRRDDFGFARRAREPRLQLHPYPSTTLFDGRGANKRWLQELPDVVNHAVWGSWVEMNPQTARSIGARSGRLVELTSSAGKVKGPAYVYTGVAPGVIAVPFGQGHSAYGRYASGRGANAFELLSASVEADSYFPEPACSVLPSRSPLVTTDASTSQQGRKLVEALMLSRLAERRPAAVDWPTPEGYSPETDIYPAHPHNGHRWAMAIDINRCVGCEACVVACYAENNIGVVGRKSVSQGREMSWLRIDRYLEWGPNHSPALFLPMLCQHCDAAPCEPVCPVFAAHHTEEGLNAQTYNRCIGTRYCSNNCPYKVRRFNWRNYPWPESLSWQLNPDVTVRVRGVMEKCTFCVQRINRAERTALKEGRPVRDGEIVPACAQTCPADVFVFGDLMDPGSRISRLVRDHPRRFQVLRDLNTKPAVFYLMKVFNDLGPGGEAA